MMTLGGLARVFDPQKTWHLILLPWGQLAAARLLHLALIVVAAIAAIRFGDRIIVKVFDPDRQGQHLDALRRRTLRGLLQSVLRYVVDFTAALMVLNDLGLPVSTLIAGASVVGLAIGFGAQNLVRDVITGFFLLYEDQFRVGETVAMAGVQGVVEEMGFRVTRVRDINGQMHVVPNGKIDLVTNFSRADMAITVKVSVPYEEPSDRVQQVLEQAARGFAASHPEVTEGPTVLGVTGLTPLGVEWTVSGKARNGQQFAAERALRLLVKEALIQAGITVAYGQQVQPGTVLRGRGPESGESS